MNLKTILQVSHETALAKGWWNKERSFGDFISLCHSELSEALEEYRCEHPLTEIYYTRDDNDEQKPEGIPVELADLIIRIADTCAHYEIDLERALAEKMGYNQKRSYRHGNKLL